MDYRLFLGILFFLPSLWVTTISAVDSGTVVKAQADDETQTCLDTSGENTCTSDNDQDNHTIKTQGKQELPCVDQHELCSFWAGLEPSECEANPKYMSRHCPKSCGTCRQETPPQQDFQDLLEFDLGVKQKIAGEAAPAIQAIVQDSIDYVRNTVLVDPKYKDVKHLCKHQHPHCAFWAFQGQCQETPKYMESNCAPVCQTCNLFIYEERCPMTRDVIGPDALAKPGDLHSMFERIVTAPEYQVYHPEVLSRPDDRINSRNDLEQQQQDETAINNNDTHDDGAPWVVTLYGFLNEQECDRLIELGAMEGYERSYDVGKQRSDGTHEMSFNQGRTSTNAWCDIDTCQKDPVVQNVMSRIANLTGIPANNSEQLQLLRYEPGQYYRTHHDYIGFQKERQSGVRMITVFLYLNDVQEGGETNFPHLDNLAVSPRRGRALIWPSVLDSDSSFKDARTRHEARPVIQGIKYGANAWIHQRDFQTPETIDCTE